MYSFNSLVLFFDRLRSVAESGMKGLSDEGHTGEEEAHYEDEEGALHVNHGESLGAALASALHGLDTVLLRLPSSPLASCLSFHYGVSNPLLVQTSLGKYALQIVKTVYE